MMMSSETRKWTREEIADRIMNDDRWTYRALLALHENQTEDEQNSQETRHRNGRGFMPQDAKWLSFMAETLWSRGRLTPNQINRVRFRTSGKPRLSKYAKQLADYANGKVKSRAMIETS